MKKLFILLFAVTLCISTTTILPDCKSHSKQNQKKSEPKRFQLYSYSQCPYCDKVKDFLKTKKITDVVEFVNADQKEHYKKLLELSNQHYCPFLWDKTAKRGVVGSDKIKSYLQNLIHKNEI